MAERRMFAKSVIGSARFLRMPSTSRLLYYDLGMQADDDGEMGCAAGIRILKNRMYGDRGTVQLDFDPVTRRFYQVGTSPNRRFDWEVSR